LQLNNKVFDFLQVKYQIVSKAIGAVVFIAIHAVVSFFLALGYTCTFTTLGRLNISSCEHHVFLICLFKLFLAICFATEPKKLFLSSEHGKPLS